jgi:hypothetical protein
MASLKSIAKSITPAPIRSVYRRLTTDNSPQLVKDKLLLIDYVCERFGMRSFADLGGVWGVDGGYSFYAIEKCAVERAYLIDLGRTPELLKAQKRHPALRIITGHFGKPENAEQIGHVDAAFMFDILLHQVSPDWDQVVKLYADKTDHFLIFNQQYTASESTVRLLDLGEQGYFENVPHTKESDVEYSDLFEKMNEVHPVYKDRTYRDMPDVWQWGITDPDLVALLSSLGFTLKYFKNCGPFGQLKKIENHAFVFSRRS